MSSSKNTKGNGMTEKIKDQGTKIRYYQSRFSIILLTSYLLLVAISALSFNITYSAKDAV
jgi:hypothetical protein